MQSNYTEKAIDLIKKLVSVDTSDISASTKAITDIVRSVVDKLPNTRLVVLPEADSQRENIIVIIGDTSIPGVVLSGHIDVVHAAAAQWSSQPYQPEIRNQKLFGRGTTDMKGFIGCALSVIEMVTQRNLPYPVYLALTCDEETTMKQVSYVMEYLLGHCAKPAIAIIGEPTGMNIASHHRGIMEQIASFKGLAAHGSRPEQGINAVCMANDFINMLRKVALPAGTPDWKTIVNVGPIAGGKSNNAVPDFCTLAFDCRMTDMKHLDQFLQQIQKASENIFETYSHANEAKPEITFDTVCLTPPLSKNNENYAQGIVANKIKTIIPSLVIDQQFSGASEAGFFDHAGISTIVMGPGYIQQAHIDDEYLEVSQIDSCCQAFEKVLVADLFN